MPSVVGAKSRLKRVAGALDSLPPADALAGGRPSTEVRPAESERRLGAVARAAWFVAIATLPLYPFPSGQPQPTDGLLAVLGSIGLALLLRERLRGARKAALALATFVGVVVMVNAVWFTALGSRDFVITTTFYVFNWVVFAGTFGFAERHGAEFARVAGLAAGISLLGHAAAAIAFPDLALSGRLHLFANNPNQLAYAALGLASIAVVAARRTSARQWLIFAAGAAASFVIMRTYSRAALFALLVLVAAAVVRRPGLLLVIAIPVLLAVLGLRDELEEDELLRARLQTVTESGLDDYLEDRGIQRVLDHPDHLLLGAGEGAHSRFHPLGLELHSSFATIAFSYGALGVAALTAFVSVLLRGGNLRTMALLAPIGLYGAFHNGLRFRVFWILLALTGATIAGERASAGRPDPRGPDPRRRA